MKVTIKVTGRYVERYDHEPVFICAPAKAGNRTVWLIVTDTFSRTASISIDGPVSGNPWYSAEVAKDRRTRETDESLARRAVEAFNRLSAVTGVTVELDWRVPTSPLPPEHVERKQLTSPGK